MSVGIPVKLFHEAKHHVVTIELKTGELYRGYLIEAEDNMNARLDSCQLTAKDGKTAYLEQVYLRGSQIRFAIIPDMFKNSPMFKRIRNLAKGKNTAALRNKARRVRGKYLILIKRSGAKESNWLINEKYWKIRPHDPFFDNFF